MKAGWEVKPLDALCTIKTGKKDVNQGNPDGQYPFFTCARDHTYSDEYSFDGEAILIAGNGEVGNLSYYSGKFEAYQRTYVLMDFAGILPAFLRYVFEGSLKPKLFDQRLGNTIPYIKKGMLTTFEVPIPPLAEQKQIVAVLDAAFEGLTRAKDNAEANLQNARELFVRAVESRFKGLSELADRKTIDSIAQVKGGKRLPKGDKFAEEITDHPYLLVKNFSDDGSIDTNGLGYLTPQTHELIKRYIIRKEDMYISIAGTIGKTGIIPVELDGANLTENAARLVFIPEIFNEYVYYFSQTADFQDQVGLNTRVAAQPKLALIRLKSVLLPIVDMAMQRKVVEEFKLIKSQTSDLEEFYRSKLTDIADLRQSLLQKAFAGYLT